MSNFSKSFSNASRELNYQLLEEIFKDNYDIKKIEGLLQSGANPNTQSPGERNIGNYRDTPLFLAISHEQLDTVKLLVHHGAKIDIYAKKIEIYGNDGFIIDESYIKDPPRNPDIIVSKYKAKNKKSSKSAKKIYKFLKAINDKPPKLGNSSNRKM